MNDQQPQENPDGLVCPTCGGRGQAMASTTAAWFEGGRLVQRMGGSMMTHVVCRDCDGTGKPTAVCTCGRIKVGMEDTDLRNWNPYCGTHGTNSDWYSKPERVAKRERDRQRLIDLQRQAAEARRNARNV